MVRETSKKAFEELVSSGKLKGQLADLLLFTASKTEPATVAEIVASTRFAKNLNCTRARFTELQQRGLIREVGQRKCNITGKRALTWVYTGRTKPLNDGRKHVKTDAKKWKEIAKRLAIQMKGCEVDSPMREAYKAFVEANGGVEP